tara:strand:- start:896 stop:1144 length:249 start_codon:yes stop_codon:yes gene_type:complete
LTILALTLALCGVNFASASGATEPKTLGLMFYSDICSSCKVLEPKLSAVKPSFEGEPILFVTLDHSNDFSKSQAALMARALK